MWLPRTCPFSLLAASGPIGLFQEAPLGHVDSPVSLPRDLSLQVSTTQTFQLAAWGPNLKPSRVLGGLTHWAQNPSA